MDHIMVSVICIAYNQAAFIAEALDSILCQKVDFEYELIVHDDASSDGTASVIAGYADRYPDRIKVILQSENQMSRGVWIGKRLQEETARGKYIAFCDGDDYWCDSCKLQKQVDYMEAHVNCSLCFHNARELHMANGTLKNIWRFDRRIYRGAGDYSSEEMILLKCVPTASMMFRKCHMPMPDFSSDKVIIGDMIRTLYLATRGYGHCMEDTMSVYRVGTKNSITACWKESIESHNRRYEAAAETLQKFDSYTGAKYHKAVEKMIEQYQNRLINYTEQDVEKIMHCLADSESETILNASINYLISNSEEEFYSRVIEPDKEWNCEEIDYAERVTGKREIILYGAGQYGRYNYKILKLCKKNVTAFCDSFSKTELVEGIPVISPLQLVNRYPNALIVISIRRGGEDVCRTLRQMGIREDQILYPRFGRLYAVSDLRGPEAVNWLPVDLKDIVKISQYILKISPDYQLYLRHNTTRLCGTVLYAALPQKGGEAI